MSSAQKYALLLLLVSSLGVGKGEQFDYIIAGAGTCGLVLANRLSADPNIKVAVIEPGSDERNNPLVQDITGFLNTFGTSLDWNYTLVDQGNVSVEYHAGHAIGGTSVINGMTYLRGDKAEFDAWELLGNEGWTWDTLYPYMKQVEQFTTPTATQEDYGASYDPDFHGESGLLKVAYPNEMYINGPFYDLARRTWESLGIPAITDANGGDTRGFYTWPMTVDRDADVRQDAARAFYQPIEDRPNLTIIKGSVTSISWSNSSSVSPSTSPALVANGVHYKASPSTPNTTATHHLSATREVILSAGALRSPPILQRSGIGSPSLLNSHSIPLRHSLPGVGASLQDQPNHSILYTVTSGTANITRYVPYSTFVTAVDLFGPKRASLLSQKLKSQIPTLAEQVSAASRDEGESLDPETLERLFQIQHSLIFPEQGEGVTIGEILTVAAGDRVGAAFWLLLPFSWGSVHLGEEEDKPVIDPKYLSTWFDVEVQTALGRMIVEFWEGEGSPMVEAGVVEERFSPGEGDLPGGEGVATDEEWESWLKAALGSNHHALGTAAMRSRDLGGVLDPEFRVYGTGNVRVVDASAIPHQFSGHLTSVLYAMSERAAEMIVKNRSEAYI